MKEETKDRINQKEFKNISLTTLGWELALPIFGGTLLGFHLDKMLELNYLLTFVLLIAGILVGYYNLVKLIQLEILRTKAAKKRQKRNGIQQ